MPYTPSATQPPHHEAARRIPPADHASSREAPAPPACRPAGCRRAGTVIEFTSACHRRTYLTFRSYSGGGVLARAAEPGRACGLIQQHVPAHARRHGHDPEHTGAVTPEPAVTGPEPDRCVGGHRLLVDQPAAEAGGDDTGAQPDRAVRALPGHLRRLLRRPLPRPPWPPTAPPTPPAPGAAVRSRPPAAGQCRPDGGCCSRPPRRPPVRLRLVRRRADDSPRPLRTYARASNRGHPAGWYCSPATAPRRLRSPLQPVPAGHSRFAPADFDKRAYVLHGTVTVAAIRLWLSVSRELSEIAGRQHLAERHHARSMAAWIAAPVSATTRELCRSCSGRWARPSWVRRV